MSIRGSIAAAIAGALMIASPLAWSVPVLNGGWAFNDTDLSGYTDHVNGAGVPNAGGSYGYLLSQSAVFRITDVLVPGDTWTVYDLGVQILMTTVQSFASGFGDLPEADADWTDAVHSKGEVTLAPGAHSITVFGDVGSQIAPAHYFARIDSVPAPATVLLLGIGLAGLGFVRRR